MKLEESMPVLIPQNGTWIILKSYGGVAPFSKEMET